MGAWAQKKAKADTLKLPWKVTAIRAGIDLVQPVKSYLVNDFSGWEVQGDVELRHLYPTLEIGHWSRNVALHNGQYENSGSYFRLGADVNLLKKDVDRNMFFLGFRLGRSKFDERLDYTIDSPVFPEVSKSITSSNVTATWGEITTGLKAKIAGGLWMGFTGRIKFAPSDHNRELQTYDIPGYGLTFKKPWWGFNYYVMWKVSWKKG